MKHHKKQYRRIFIGMLLLGSTATMMHACAWDDSLYEEFVIVDANNDKEKVVSCDNLQQIMIYNTETQQTTTYERDKDEGDFANAFTYNLCPEKAHNCIHEGNDENKPGICNNCPEQHAVCKRKCVDIMNPNLHIDNCGSDNLECEDDYYDLNDDASDGCEFQLSLVNIDKDKPQNPDGSWNCLDGYADIDEDPYNGCEINGWTDNMHCGAGGISKQNPIEGEECKPGHVCTGGECKVSCGEDYIVVCDKLCSNTKIDNAHCGGCNRTCSLTVNDARAAVACQEGGCHAIACQPGYYLEDADEAVAGKIVKTCKPCADGKYTTSATATGCEECKTTTGAKSMVFDPKNNICKAASCLAGYVLDNNTGLCSPLNCPTGQHVHVNDCEEDNMENCGAHGKKCTVLTYGETDCINGQCVYTCNAGYYWEDSCDNHEGKCCKPCPEGSYCPTAGLTSPIPCLVGHYCPDTTSDHPTPCPEGTYQENMESTQCEPCGNNQISAAGSAMCAECKGNTRANSDHTACVGCNNVGNVDDTCVKTTGAATMRCSSKNICKAASCLPGYKLVNNEKCEPCPAGSISTSDNKCTQCLAGTYAEDNECKQCPAGSYCPTVGLTSPIPCPKGHYCTGGVSSPAPCPMGTYRNELSGTKEGDCSNCPKGRHNDGVGAYECALIPAGYVGVNCKSDPDPKESNSDDFNKKEGCMQYSTCFGDNNSNSVTKCSSMYGNESECQPFGHCYTANTSSCIVEHPGCPATDCCNGACATNNDNCGTCGNKCTDNKTCKFSDNTWKCQ